MNAFAPSQELYELALIAMLGTPALVFVRVVTQMGANVDAGSVPTRAVVGDDHPPTKTGVAEPVSTK